MIPTYNTFLKSIKKFTHIYTSKKTTNLPFKENHASPDLEFDNASSQQP